jgi:hypothetical protein
VLQLRLLVLHASDDDPTQHLTLMNCAFAAQKHTVMLDALVLAPVDSLLLQQAATYYPANYFLTSTAVFYERCLMTDHSHSPPSAWHQERLPCPKLCASPRDSSAPMRMSHLD